MYTSAWGGTIRGAMTKPTKRSGTKSTPCPKCKANSYVIVTRRVDGIVIRVRSCMRHPSHVFKTKEVHVEAEAA